MAAELETWWFEKAKNEIEATVPKAIEYSATDLFDMGRDLAETMGRDVRNMDDADLAELGVYVYVLGKVSRWKGAIKDGRKVSDDTIADLAVYARMVQRIRDAGGWPGTPVNNTQEETQI